MSLQALQVWYSRLNLRPEKDAPKSQKAFIILMAAEQPPERTSAAFKQSSTPRKQYTLYFLELLLKQSTQKRF